MKNLIYLITMTAIVLTACSKDSMPKGLQSGIATHSIAIHPSENNYYKQEQSGQEVSYSIKDGRIILANAEDFKIFMWALESIDLSKWEDEVQFHSYNTTHPNNELRSDACIELESALNPSGVIQIEPYVFKFNPSIEQILVMKSNATIPMETFSQMNTSSGEVLEFSFEDDIWYLLENNIHPEEDLSEQNLAERINKKCQEQKAFTKKEVSTSPACTGTIYWWQEVSFVLKYSRFGIWETCKASFANNYYNVYSQTNGVYEDFHIYGGQINYHFDERCGPAYQGSFNLPAMITDQLSMTLRSDKKPLARYKSNVSMDIVFKYLCAPNDPVQQQSITLTNF